MYTFIDLLSEVGGLGSAVFTLLLVMGRELNGEFLKNKIIRVLYFVKTSGFIGKNSKKNDKKIAKID